MLRIMVTLHLMNLRNLHKAVMCSCIPSKMFSVVFSSTKLYLEQSACVFVYTCMDLSITTSEQHLTL